jgi:hypothetical protein
VHASPWPSRRELESLIADDTQQRQQEDLRIYQWATYVLFEVRKQRSEAKQPPRVPIVKVSIKAEPEARRLMPNVEADLKAALRVQQFDLTIGEPREVRVEGYALASEQA